MRVAPINRDDECHLIVSCTLNWLEQKKGNKRREDKTRPLKESFKAPRIIFFIILKRKKMFFFCPIRSIYSHGILILSPS